MCGYDTFDPNLLFEIHKRVGLVFQNPETQIVGAVVEDDAAFAPENQGLAPDEIEARISDALTKVGLIHKRRALSSALSGGEKQRLALAGALAARAECLILDEPTAMLDPEGRAQVEGVLNDIHGSGATIIQVTHKLEDAVGADRVFVLSKGKLIWQGSRDGFWKTAESLGYCLPPLIDLARRLNIIGVINDGSVEGISESILSRWLDDRRFKNGRTFTNERTQFASAAPFFAVRNLSYSFDSSTPLETQVLKDISCEIPLGKWTSILGRTGSGKSTLIQHLNSLYKIQKGEILIADSPIPQSGAELMELRRRVGLVFQTPEDQFFSPTVKEELAFAPQNWGFSRPKVDEAVNSALLSVGLSAEYLSRNPLLLSGGERRLVAIASVLSSEPECLVLDEPTAGLDERYRERIVDLLSMLRKDGKTIITVTHDFEMAFEKSDRIILLENGIKSYEGSVRDGLPVLLENNKTFMPPILRVAATLRGGGLDVPLTWRLEELWEGLAQNLMIE
ncbi:ABC transporter ATP-binding protein [Synergistales bacterium]|nr:ABC transporter ATP-binding protein [Synergistales bacterium]